MNSSTPKRPATILPTSPSEVVNTKRNKTFVSPISAPPTQSSKSKPSTSNPPKACATKPTTTTKSFILKTTTKSSISKTTTKFNALKAATVLKSKSSTPAPVKQKSPLYSTVASPSPGSSTFRHSSQAPSPQAPVTPNPIHAPRCPRPAPFITPQLAQDTRTNSFYVHFDLKYWKSETEVLIALNNEYPMLQFDIKGKLGQSLTISVPNVENFTVFASLKQLNNKPIPFVPKQPFPSSIQSVISNVPGSVLARSFLSINEIVSAERMYSWSKSLKRKVPTTNIKVV